MLTDPIKPSRISVGFFYATAALIAICLPGCGGYTTHRPFLFGMDLSVEWVFQAPSQFGSTIVGVWFSPRTGDIGGAVCTEDGKIVVLSNYGHSWGYAQDCNGYLLDFDSGRVIRRVKGPYGTMGPWYLDGKMIYVADYRDDSHRGEWWALDLATGRKLTGIREPKGTRYEEFGLNPGQRQPVPFSEEPGDDAWTRYRHTLGRGRELVITARAQWEICADWGPFIPMLELVCTDAAGKRHKRRLGRLRRVNEIACHVLINDERRLLFCTGSHVICVDMRKFPAPLEPPKTQPAASTRRREPRDPEDSIREF